MSGAGFLTAKNARRLSRRAGDGPFNALLLAILRRVAESALTQKESVVYGLGHIAPGNPIASGLALALRNLGYSAEVVASPTDPARKALSISWRDA